jgi:hypothetical protein
MTGPVHTVPLRRALLASVFLAASWAHPAAGKAPAEPAVSKVLVMGDVSVSLAWSPRWQLETAAPKGMPGTVEFRAADRMQMVTMLTPIGGTSGLTADDAMKELVTKSSRQFEGQAVEKEIEIQRISSGEAHGYFVCLTDKAPKSGEYRFLCQGLVSLRDLPINFIVLYNDGGKADAEQVLAALKTIRIADLT